MGEKHTFPGVDVTEITYHPSFNRSNRFSSNDTSYVNPRESLTVVKSLWKDNENRKINYHSN